MGCTTISVLSESVASYLCYLMLTCKHANDATHSFRYLSKHRFVHRDIAVRCTDDSSTSFFNHLGGYTDIKWCPDTPSRGVETTPSAFLSEVNLSNFFQS